MAALAAALGPKVELLGPAEMGQRLAYHRQGRGRRVGGQSVRPLLVEASRAGGPRMSVDVEPLEVLAVPR